MPAFRKISILTVIEAFVRVAAHVLSASVVGAGPALVCLNSGHSDGDVMSAKERSPEWYFAEVCPG